MSELPTLAERVASCFTPLTIAAVELNSVTDELGKSVAQIDDALKRLNLGISVWVMVSKWSDNAEDSFGSHMLGYDKCNGKWGICLRTVEGDLDTPDDTDEETWLFSDGPRALRLSAIDKIPDLLERLSLEAVKAAKLMKAKLEDVQSVAAAMTPQPVSSAKKELTK